MTLHPLHFSVAPVSVNIVNKVDRLVVGRESEIVCRSTGSRPPAHITWYLGGQRLEGGGTESVSIGQKTTKDLVTTKSILQIIKSLGLIAWDFEIYKM